MERDGDKKEFKEDGTDMKETWTAAGGGVEGWKLSCLFVQLVT